MRPLAIVTGSTRGLGLAIVRGLHARGFDVVGIGRSEPAAGLPAMATTSSSSADADAEAEAEAEDPRLDDAETSACATDDASSPPARDPQAHPC